MPAGGDTAPSPHWTAPTVIVSANSEWTRPTIVADAHGRLHVLWADRKAPDKTAKGDGLYHMVWDGQRWSAPTRVADTRTFCLVYQTATIGSDDQIYVVWSGQSALYLSRAPAATAHDPAAWLPPRLVVQQSMIDQSRIVRSPDGRLHVVYARLASDDGPAGNVFSVSSADGGSTWSTPVQVGRIPVQQQAVSSVPRLVVDGDGALHAAWDEPAAPSWVSRRILYSRSDDGGQTWTEPMQMSSLDEGDHNTSPSLAITDPHSVHLIWGCVGPPTRCYRVSTDGGRQWSASQRIAPDFVSMAGWDALVVDARSTLHLVAQLRMPYGMYHTFKPVDGAWQRPALFVGEKDFEDGHFVSAVAVGTDVHAVWQKGPNVGDVVYAHMTLAPEAALTPPAAGAAGAASP